MNCVLIVGRITKDIELRQMSSGTSNCLFTLAVDRGFKDEQGNVQCDFISCVAWSGQAEFLSRYCRKGDRVGVKGRLQTRNYQDQSGATRFITEVVVEQVESYTPKPQQQPQQQEQPVNYNTGMKVNGKSYNPTDDDTDWQPF